MATNDKYDRQLRLWGAKGQKALSDTTVVLFRATAAGTETLKNLVLPGIGHVVVVDDATVLHQQYQSNFFVTKANVGNNKPRAQLAWESLQELNPDVHGKFLHVPQGLTTALASSSAEGCGNDLWLQLTTTTNSTNATNSRKTLLVIASDCEPPLLHALSRLCDQDGIPMIAVQSYGLIGLVRLQTPPLPLLDPKPSSAPPDLRLVNPFPALAQLAANIAWQDLPDHEHGHVPYPLLLLRIAKEYQDQHEGKLPATQNEKQVFRDAIVAAARDMNKEVNFEEAVQNAYLAYTECTLDQDFVAQLRNTVAALVTGQNNKSSTALQKLHALLQALDMFLKHHGQQPPLHGTIPDMTASTEWYVKLQQIYHDQAAAHVQELERYLPSTTLGITHDDIVTFCQNVNHLDVFQTRTIVDEYNNTSRNSLEELVDDWNMATYDPHEVPEHTPLLWYMGLRACQVFYQQHGRYPGTATATDYGQDAQLLQGCIEKVAQDMSLAENDLVRSTLLLPASSNGPCNIALELTRYGNAEIHPIATLVGGVASQEAVKIITGQYVPLNNTYIYNGIASVGGVTRC